MLFGPALGVLAPFVFVALFVLLMMSRPVAALGTELRLWCSCYLGYLLVFLHPQTSTFRMLLPLFPLALSAALVSRSRAYRGTVVLMFLLLQIVWIVWLWAWAPPARRRGLSAVTRSTFPPLRAGSARRGRKVQRLATGA